MSTLYKDKLIKITDGVVVFRHYYFPFGDKQVPFERIENIQARPPGLANGRWRMWGTGNLRTWFPLDLKRPSRSVIFFVSLRDSKRRIGFTAEDAGSVEAVLRQCGLLQPAQPA